MQKTTNPAYQKLSKVRSMLDFVKEPPRNQTHGVAVGLSVVAKVKEWALKQPDPMDDEAQRKTSQVRTWGVVVVTLFPAPNSTCTSV